MAVHDAGSWCFHSSEAGFSEWVRTHWFCTRIIGEKPTCRDFFPAIRSKPRWCRPACRRVGADQLCCFIHAAVQRLDRNAFLGVYSEEGGALYHPALMLKVGLYACGVGLTSAGALSAAARGASSDATEVAQPGGTPAVGAAQDGGGTGAGSAETTTWDAAVSHARPEQSSKRVHPGGGGLQPHPPRSALEVASPARVPDRTPPQPLTLTCTRIRLGSHANTVTRKDFSSFAVRLQPKLHPDTNRSLAGGFQPLVKACPFKADSCDQF